MSRILPPISAGLAGLGLCLGGAWLAATAEPSMATNCPIAIERFFTLEQPLPEDRILASHFVLLRNPEAQALAYALSFTQEGAQDRRIGARATLPGARSLPVLLGREVLTPGQAPRTAAQLEAATRLSCRG